MGLRPSSVRQQFTFLTSSQKPLARSTSNLVGMCLGWVSAKFVQMGMVQRFLDFLWIFLFIFGENLKKSSSPKLLGQLLWNCIGTYLETPQTLICPTGGAAIFFQFFYEFFCVFAIFDFFSKTVTQIVLKLGGYVPCGRVTQGCSPGGVAVDPWFLTNFSIWVLVGQCIHSYW